MYMHTCSCRWFSTCCAESANCLSLDKCRNEGKSSNCSIIKLYRYKPCIYSGDEVIHPQNSTVIIGVGDVGPQCALNFPNHSIFACTGTSIDCEIAMFITYVTHSRKRGPFPQKFIRGTGANRS